MENYLVRNIKVGRKDVIRFLLFVSWKVTLNYWAEEKIVVGNDNESDYNWE